MKPSIFALALGLIFAVACTPPQVPSSPNGASATPPSPEVRTASHAAPLKSALSRPEPRDFPYRDATPVRLGMGHVTIEQIVHIARGGAPVRAEAALMDRLDRAHRLLLAAARHDIPVYGLNRGVGENKDKTIFQGDALSAETKQASERFNAALLRAHSAGLGDNLPESTVRALMAIRLNTILAGHTGCQRSVAQMYIEFLNRHIHPLVPSIGSVGEADITVLPHIGLAMMGEGEVLHRGERMPASRALTMEGLSPLKPYAKDALAITSSNAHSASLALMALHDAEQLLDSAEAIYALSLEGLNGNVAPMLPIAQDLQGYPEQSAAAGRIRRYLDGSYLWQPDPARPLQDPLSFRDMSHLHGAARAAIEVARRSLTLQINQSDDNPAVILDVTPPAEAPPAQRAAYVVEGDVRGAVVPTANFEPVAWALPLQAVNVAFAHVSRASCYRTLKLSMNHFTGLTRFLAPDDTAIAFGAIQKPCGALDADIRTLANPVSLDFLPVAGDIEDQGTNAPLIAHRLRRIGERLAGVFGLELLHAAQAVDLRLRKNPSLPLGRSTRRLHSAFRTQVAFLDKDRALTPDIRASLEFVAGGHVLRALERD
ncbi:aromatic amino acid lyase [Pendulispora rubella]|uniref:Aromatic amino acid lyase n=1 Tax=Pendulispora rubella TaxID=2741070 RepID=A0ABZ2LBN6_9BACT